MAINVTDPIFADEDQARAYFEGIRWPDGVTCPHCGNTKSARIYSIAANPKRKIRAGLYECQDCHGQFTVRTGSVMESRAMFHLTFPTTSASCELSIGCPSGPDRGS